MIQSLDMWWSCDGGFYLNCISSNFANKVHLNKTALFFFSKKFSEDVDFNSWRYPCSQSNNYSARFLQ